MATTPEKSDYTSIKERIKPSIHLQQAVEEQIQQGTLLSFNYPLKPLAKFEGDIKGQKQLGILFSLESYLQLVARSYASCIRDIRASMHVTIRAE